MPFARHDGFALGPIIPAFALSMLLEPLAALGFALGLVVHLPGAEPLLLGFSLPSNARLTAAIGSPSLPTAVHTAVLLTRLQVMGASARRG
jgi:hypothetical protein